VARTEHRQLQSSPRRRQGRSSLADVADLAMLDIAGTILNVDEGVDTKRAHSQDKGESQNSNCEPLYDE
jgi:hypothetical protein